MKIFIAQPRFPFPFYISGADLANLSFANSLTKTRKATIKTLYTTGPHVTLEQIQKTLKKFNIVATYASPNHLRYTWQSIEINVISFSDFLETFINWEREFKPDWLWIQNPLFNCDQTPFINSKTKKFTYFQSVESIHLSAPFKDQLITCFSNSTFIQKEAKKNGYHSTVILPLPEDNCIAPRISPETNTYITMINPVEAKGADILWKIIQNCPSRQFLIVYGWHQFPNSKYPFESLPNVTIHPPTLDIKDIYAKTRICLIPSLWEEAFCRVHIESAYNGIPCIVSNKGGLKTLFSGNGIKIDTPHNTKEWIKAIHYLDDAKAYTSASKKALELGKSLSYEAEYRKFSNYLSELT